jgi:predicted secreted protein
MFAVGHDHPPAQGVRKAMRDIWIATVSTVCLLALLLHLPSPEARVIQLNERDNGSDVHLKSGQELVIHVESADGEPAAWKVGEANREVLAWGEPEYRERQPIRLGAPVDVVWRFRAVHTGTTPLRLDLESLPDIQPTRVDRSFSVVVQVD